MLRRFMKPDDYVDEIAYTHLCVSINLDLLFSTKDLKSRF